MLAYTFNMVMLILYVLIPWIGGIVGSALIMESSFERTSFRDWEGYAYLRGSTSDYLNIIINIRYVICSLKVHETLPPSHI
jgi:hypothetical protein